MTLIIRHPKHKTILVTDDVTKQANLSLARKHAYFLESGTSANCRFKQIIEMPLFIRSELSEGVQASEKQLDLMCITLLYRRWFYKGFI